MGVFVLKEPEEDEEEDKEDPGDWPLLLDNERGPGWPKVLQSSENIQTCHNDPDSLKTFALQNLYLQCINGKVLVKQLEWIPSTTFFNSYV